MSEIENAYGADRSIFGKARRRLTRFMARRPALRSPGRPMLSIAFDDAPSTATQEGARILDAYGVKGTFYAAAGLCGRTEPMGVCAEVEDYQRLHEAGHEIGCHTYSHLDCGQASGATALKDVAQNASSFEHWGLPKPRSFAYPYGDVAPWTKSALAPSFTSLRALHPGLIQAGSDLNQAPAVGIEGDQGETKARHWLNLARSQQAWLILYTHDVQQDPSPWGCTPSALDSLVREAIETGFDLVTVGDGADRLSG